MKPFNPHVLTINGGSSSIKFALYQIGKPLQLRLHGSVDRIGLPGTTLSFSDAGGTQKVASFLILLTPGRYHIR